MKKHLLTILLILSSNVFLGQTQIGSDIDGSYTPGPPISIGDALGWAVSMSADGTTIAGSSKMYGGGVGYVKVYRYINGAYTQLGSTIINSQASHFTFGGSISLSGDGSILAIGDTSYSGDKGDVMIYKFISGNWVPYGNNIVGGNVNYYMGSSVSMSEDGTKLAVSIPGDSTNGTNSGQVRIYTYVSGNWVQLGNSINGQAGDSIEFLSLTGDGNSLAIGAPLSHLNGTNSGTVRIFHYNSGVWSQIGSDIYGTIPNTNSLFSLHALSLSSDANTVAIGDVNHNLVKIYQNIANNWTQVGPTITGEAGGDNFGSSLSLSGDASLLAVGAPFNAGNGYASGSVRLYKNIAGNWTKIGSDIDGEAVQDGFGRSVSLNSNGSRLVVGTPDNDGGGADSGHMRVYDLSGVLSSNSFVLDNFNIYPNPTSETLTVTLQENIKLEKVNIYNELGQLIKRETTKNINVAFLAKGNYYVEVITDKGKATKTIIVK